jgi:hypothetical protein
LQSKPILFSPSLTTNVLIYPPQRLPTHQLLPRKSPRDNEGRVKLAARLSTYFLTCPFSSLLFWVGVLAMLMFFPFHDQCGDLLTLTISQLSVFREGGAGNALDENFLLPWSTLHSTLPWNERLTYSPVLFSATAPMDWLGLVVLVDSVRFTWPCTDESVCPSGY